MLTAGFHDVPPGHVAMVVTHLEMTAKPGLRGVAEPEGLNFEPLPRDIGVYRNLFHRVGGPWLWFGRLQLSDISLTETLTDPKVKLWTLAKNGQPEAILELDFREDGACELAYFGLTPELVGLGAGAFLIDRAIEMAWAEPINRFHVHTCTLDSPQALSFYVRSGFTPYRREIEVAPDPRLTGVLPADAAPAIAKI